MSDRDPGLSVLIPSAGMEICRLYAAVSLLFMLPELGILPFVPAALILFAAMFLSRFLRQLKSRTVTGLLLNLIGCTAAAGFLLDGFRGLPFRNAANWSQWAGSFAVMRGFEAWFAFTIIVMTAGLFWIRGAAIGRKDGTHRRTLGRFDIGILLFLYIYLLRLGIGSDDPYAVQIVASYLLLGIVALFSARIRSSDRGFTGRRSAAGLMILFTAGFVILGTVVLLLHPLLVRTAVEVFSVLREASKPLSPWFIAALRFIFGLRRSSPGAAAGSNDSGPTPPMEATEEPGPLARLIGEIVMYGLAGVLILLSAGIVVYLLWRLVRKLLASSEEVSGQLTLREILRGIFSRIKKILAWMAEIPALIRRRLEARRSHSARPDSPGTAEFRFLTSWGRRSGIPRRRDETPAEYGARITARFPAVGEAAALIIRHVESEFYGSRRLGRTQCAELRRAGRDLRQPGLFPARILNRLGLQRGTGSRFRRGDTVPPTGI